MKTIMKVPHPAGIAINNRPLLDAFIELCLRIDNMGTLRDEFKGIDQIEITGEESQNSEPEWGQALGIRCHLKIPGVEPAIGNAFLSVGTFLFVTKGRARASHACGPTIEGQIKDVLDPLAASLAMSCLELAQRFAPTAT